MCFDGFPFFPPLFLGGGGAAKNIRSRVAAAGVPPAESALNFVVGAVFVVRSIFEEFPVRTAVLHLVAKVAVLLTGCSWSLSL